MKIVYVCVGTEKKQYLNMLKISIMSVRKHMPKIDIYVVTDKETEKCIIENHCFDEYNVIIISQHIPDNYSTIEKSRYLKTKLREIIRGDFLYIDSDTIICEDFSDNTIEYSIGMVLDGHRYLYEQDDAGQAIKLGAKKRGYDLDDCVKYFNGGVIQAKDDETARAFFNNWFNEWNRTKKAGMYQDQFSLNAVNQKMDVIHELSGGWNCQITNSYRAIGYIRNVKVLHYFSIQEYGIYKLNDISLLTKETDEAQIREIIDCPERAFEAFHMLSDISIEFKIMNTSHFHFIKRIYMRHKKLFDFMERILMLLRKK